MQDAPRVARHVGLAAIVAASVAVALFTARTAPASPVRETVVPVPTVTGPIPSTAKPGDSSHDYVFSQSFDVFSQIGRLAKSRSGPFTGYKVDHVYAAGVSQSSRYLSVYYNTVQDQANVYDGFVPGSRRTARPHRRADEVPARQHRDGRPARTGK